MLTGGPRVSPDTNLTNEDMKRLTQWVLAAILTFCGTMMMLTSSI